MSVPELKHIVEKVYARGGFTLSTLDGCGEFTRACTRQVYAVDKRFMLLRKKASRTHVVDSKGRLHGADVVLFVESPSKAIAVDIIASSASPEARPSWGPERDKTTKKPIYRYTAADALPPDADAEPDPDPHTPDKPPVPPVPQDLEARIAAIEGVLRHHRLLP